MRLIFILWFLSFISMAHAQNSIARSWNELVLEGIRNDYARPTVHARNLFHASIAMYDAWACFDVTAELYFLGKTIGNYSCEFNGFPAVSDTIEARKSAISYAMYRLIQHRFKDSPGGDETLAQAADLMIGLGLDTSFYTTNYESGNAAALGNYIAQEIINFGFQDGSNEALQYTNLFYESVNEPMVIDTPGNVSMTEPDHWQPLTLEQYIDQAGNVIDGLTPGFLSPEWGNVIPFALSDEDKSVYDVNGNEFIVYHDPGMPWLIQSGENLGLDDPYKWGFSMVTAWSSHLDTSDGVMWDISPNTLGNNPDLPNDFEGFKQFYNFNEGGDSSQGYDINPATGEPYEEQWVRRADYTRVLAEFWADGPDSETPPGHWFTILNYVNDHPSLKRRFQGLGPELDPLEWDVKAYFMLAGAMHDCAVAAWGIKGYYDYVRPVSAIRYMAEKGQSSDQSASNFDPHGFPLLDGFFETIELGDPLAGPNDKYLGEIKIKAWKGPDYIDDPDMDDAGVDWIRAKEWWPYQRPSFVTPPFAGYISGHSTFSRAAAEVLTLLTGDPFFPGGMSEFIAEKNEFLVFEEGPSETIVLQWATYRDASDQTSLSRIWGGIHPPIDDIPGRKIGIDIGNETFLFARDYFYNDVDEDGIYNYADCDDNDPFVYPGAQELCDGKDNDCNGLIDDGIEYFTYFWDSDGDGDGDPSIFIDTCLTIPLTGYVVSGDDCNDSDEAISSMNVEVCDGKDNDCNGLIDDQINYTTFYVDNDGDGYGQTQEYIDTCWLTAASGYSSLPGDCDDSDELINPGVIEIADNFIDENCDGEDLIELTRLFPNPVSDQLHFHSNVKGKLSFEIYTVNGILKSVENAPEDTQTFILKVTDLPGGLYILIVRSHEKGPELYKARFVKN